MNPVMHTFTIKCKVFQTVKYATVNVHTLTNTVSQGHTDLFANPESSLMAYLRENNHFSSAFEQQVGACYVAAMKQH